MCYRFGKNNKRMSDATVTAFLLTIPMALLTIAQIGILRKRAIFAVLGLIVTILTSGLLLAASFASQMAAGSGSGGSGGWEGLWPLPLSLGLGFALLLLGFVTRPKATVHDTPEIEEARRLPTMRQAAAENKQVGPG